jgi:hypothetical protein
MIKFYSTILLGLSFFSAASQEILSEPEAKTITKFPFNQYSGGVMVVQARFANIPDTLNFILDTGSGGISLDSATCSEFNIPLVQTDTTITGIGGIRKVPFAFNQTLHLPGLDVEHLNFHVNDYEVLSSVYGEKVDGIIGYSFFSRYIVKINFDSSSVEVLSAGKINYPAEGTLLTPVFTSLPIQWLRIRDKRKIGFNFYFDTGAGLCFLMSEAFASDSSILLSKRKPVVTQAEGMGGRLQMRLTVIKELKVGPYKFYNVPTYLYKDEFNVTSYPFVGGLLGNDLLRRFNITFNYAKRQIHLEPNSRFNEGFDYAYTGLGIYFIDGKILVEDVIKDSPAYKAGFKEGDELLAVGNNFSRNIQKYKDILQVANEKINVLVMRNEKPLLLTIKTESIF